MAGITCHNLGKVEVGGMNVHLIWLILQVARQNHVPYRTGGFFSLCADEFSENENMSKFQVTGNPQGWKGGEPFRAYKPSIIRTEGQSTNMKACRPQNRKTHAY